MGEFYNDQWRLPNNENKDKSSNYSMSFDSSGPQIIQATKDLSSLTACSISCWVKFDFTETSFQYACIVGNAAGAGQMLTIAKQNTTGGNANKFYVWDGGAAHITTKVAADNTWYHAVVTQTGTTIKVYINNAEVSGGGFTGSALNLDNGATKPTITLGAYFVTGFIHELEGQLDHVAIFDYALTDGTGGTVDQIAELYGNSTDGVGNPMSLSTKPVAYYKLGEKAAFNGSEYLVTNAASEVYSPYALDFDGSNDYITLSNITIFTDFSLSFWYKKDSAVGGIDAVVGKDTIDGGILTSIAFTSGKLHFKNRPGSWTALTTTLSSNTEFKHYSITYNSTANELKGYCNGVLEVTTTPVFSGATGSEHSFNRIGRYSSANYLDGKLTNLSTFNSPLTSSQVTEIYNQGKPSNLNNHSAYSNLVSWWQLGENMSYDGTNWTVLDEKGTNNGTSANMGEDAIVNGVGTTANGLSSGMGSGDNVIGEAPYSTANALSIDMGVEARTDDTPS